MENFNVRFKCFGGVTDGYQAVFHIYDKTDRNIHYKINFEISDTQYNSEFNNTKQLTGGYIDKKFGNLENCFKEVGVKFIKERIKDNQLEDEVVNLLKFI
ncbi:MAG: hypothetical protein ACOZAJ_01840, partial [Patescibacteria group bacterium]